MCELYYSVLYYWSLKTNVISNGSDVNSNNYIMAFQVENPLTVQKKKTLWRPVPSKDHINVALILHLIVHLPIESIVI